MMGMSLMNLLAGEASCQTYFSNFMFHGLALTPKVFSPFCLLGFFLALALWLIESCYMKA